MENTVLVPVVDAFVRLVGLENYANVQENVI